MINTHKAFNQLVQLNKSSRHLENDLLAMFLLHELVHGGKVLPLTQFTDILDAQLKHKYDLVLVDGPPSVQKLNRYPALPYLHGKLAERFSFYLDDAQRQGETQVVKRWEPNARFPSKYVSAPLPREVRGMFSTAA